MIRTISRAGPRAGKCLWLMMLAAIGLAVIPGWAQAKGDHDDHGAVAAPAVSPIGAKAQFSVARQRDCDQCPAMVMIPPGEFVMGDALGRKDEQPAHRVRIERPFFMSVFEVSFAEWKSCVDDGGCARMPGDEGWGRTARPVIGVSWREAVAYTAWLSGKSGRTYRLASEAEWEYAARAGTATQYWWGDGYDEAQAAFCGSKWDAKRTQPVGVFPANAFGLHDTLGNVWEWVQDCYSAEGYVDADGSARARDGGSSGQSCARVLRGGSWQTYPRLLRSARRYSGGETARYSDAGVRVVRDAQASEISAVRGVQWSTGSQRPLAGTN